MRALWPWLVGCSWLIASLCRLPCAHAQVGDTAAALPGIVQVGTPVTQRRPWSFAADGGYGLTESQAGEGAHHRLSMSLAAAVGLADFLALGARFDGRYDRHPADTRVVDDGWVGDPRLYLRAGRALGPKLSLGAELLLWVPGQQAPSLDFAASTLDGKALLAWSPSPTLTVAAISGYRIDSSARTVSHANTLRAGDRLALGLSDFDAVLLGLGASRRWGKAELLAELSADLLLGKRAPALEASPLRANLGARYQATRRLTWELCAGASLSARPTLGSSAAYTPIEPRVSVLFGVRYALVAPPPAPPAPAAQKQAPAPLPQVANATLRGRVLDKDGAPVADASVKASAGDLVRETRSDADGRYELTDLPLGHVQLSISGPGLEASTQELELDGAEVHSDLSVTRAAPDGQLRGIIRAFSGKPLQATIHVRALDRAAHADASGYFEIDVPPGEYDVDIEHAGYRAQKRKLTVENNGVTLLNVELHEQ